MGFQHMHSVIREAAQRKGGSKRVRKGIGALPPERRKEIASLGGKKKHENYIREKGTIKAQTGSREYSQFLERVYKDIDEQVS